MINVIARTRVQDLKVPLASTVRDLTLVHNWCNHRAITVVPYPLVINIMITRTMRLHGLGLLKVSANHLPRYLASSHFYLSGTRILATALNSLLVLSELSPLLVSLVNTGLEYYLYSSLCQTHPVLNGFRLILWNTHLVHGLKPAPFSLSIFRRLTTSSSWKSGMVSVAKVHVNPFKITLTGSLLCAKNST